VTSFFGITGAFFSNDKTNLRQIFFQSLGENTCSLQPALKSNALVLLFQSNISKHLLQSNISALLWRRGNFVITNYLGQFFLQNVV